MKINSLEIENLKRIRAVTYEPSENGLTIIGGDNAQGKTSVLDAIVWCLGGDRYKPTQAQRKDSLTPPRIRIVLNNGLVVERKGQNSALKVTRPDGGTGGQKLLDDFISQFAINLPKFMNSTQKEKADMLLDIIGVRDRVYALRKQAEALYNERRTIGQIASQKAKYAAEQQEYPEAPEKPVSVIELIQRQQAILAKNGENQRLRNNLVGLLKQRSEIQEAIQKYTEILNEKIAKAKELDSEIATAQKTVEALKDESTAEIERDLAEIEEINRKVQANLNKEKAMEDANNLQNEYDGLTQKLTDIRNEMKQVLNSSKLPLKGLSFENDMLCYNGAAWDCMSSAEQLKVAVAIARAQNPNCEFVLVDKLEQMDRKTLKEFAEWTEAQGLQIIATRVSTGDECSIIIEDGCIKGDEQYSTWKWEENK